MGHLVLSSALDVARLSEQRPRSVPRSSFEAMIGDADELNWLDYDTMAAKWDLWAQRFTSHYGLDEKQQAALTKLLEGTERQTRNIKALPEVKGSTPEQKKIVSFAKTVIKYDEDQKGRSGSIPRGHPKPSEFDRIRNQFPAEHEEDEAKARTKSQDRVPRATQSASKINRRQLSYKQKLAAELRGNPNVAGAVYVAESSGR